MDTITGIRDLDTYLLLFFDQDTIYNYSLVSKETNRIVTGHVLFGLLKEYHETHFSNEDILTWAIRKDMPYILNWHMNFGHKFVNIFPLVNLAITSGSTEILDWFYQRGMFDYTLESLQHIVIIGKFDIVEWFFNHKLEISYLDNLLRTLDVINNYHDHGKLLSMLKWLQQRNYPIKFNFDRLSRIITADSIELFNWLLEHQMIDRFIFTNGHSDFLFNMAKSTVEKQLEILTFVKEFGWHFDESDLHLFLNRPIELLEWYTKNVPQVTLDVIVRMAASSNNISVMEWTGINKDHPVFNLVNDDYMFRQALNSRHTDTIVWYCKNMSIRTPFLTDLFDILGSLRDLTIEKIMVLEKQFAQSHATGSSTRLHPTVLVHKKLLKAAFRNENISVVKYLKTKIPSKVTDYICAEDVSHCISSGYIKSLNWLEKYIDPTCPCLKDDCSFKSAIDAAAAKNRLETIKWVHKFFPNKIEYEHAIDNAASRSHADVLNWFDEIFGTSMFKYSHKAVDGAIFFNKLQPLKWFHRSKHPIKYSTDAINDAVHSNNSHFLQWFKENEYPMIFTIISIHLACETYTCETLQWLKDNGVITILDKYSHPDDFLVFRIEVAQPFNIIRKDGISYKIIVKNIPDNHYIEIVSVDNEQINYAPAICEDSQIFEIRYRQKELINVLSNTEIHNRPINIFHSLCWFERCYMSQQK